MVASVAVKLLAVLGPPRLADDPYRAQLRTFQSWAHSPFTAVLLVVAYAGLVALVVAPPGRRLAGPQAGATGRVAVVALGILALAAWLSRDLWFILLTGAALWACLAWVITAAGILATVMSLPDRLATELIPARRREHRRERSESVDRGAALTRVLDKIEGERR